MKPAREPTYTSIILAHLQSIDDLVDRRALSFLMPKEWKPVRKDATVFASLIHLRKHRLVDVVVQPDGSYWYALPPEGDTRYRVLKEIIHDAKRPNRKRKPKVVKEPTP